jgi:hypothetical protein
MLVAVQFIQLGMQAVHTLATVVYPKIGQTQVWVSCSLILGAVQL